MVYGPLRRGQRGDVILQGLHDEQRSPVALDRLDLAPGDHVDDGALGAAQDRHAGLNAAEQRHYRHNVVVGLQLNPIRAARRLDPLDIVEA